MTTTLTTSVNLNLRCGDRVTTVPGDDVMVIRRCLTRTTFVISPPYLVTLWRWLLAVSS